MKKVLLISTMLLLLTGCNEEEVEQIEQQIEVEPRKEARLEVEIEPQNATIYYDPSSTNNCACIFKTEYNQYYATPKLDEEFRKNNLRVRVSFIKTSKIMNCGFAGPLPLVKIAAIERIGQQNSIYGKWNLIKFEGGFSPTKNFNPGEISWNFQQNNVLKVEVDNTISSPPLKEPREYNFSINGDRLLIDNIKLGIDNYDYGSFSIDGNKLILDDNPAVDGYRATFSREINYPIEIDFIEICKGQSGLSESSNLVITNQTDWEDLMAKLSFNGSINIKYIITETDIDFSANIVIAIFLGMKPTGWEVEISSIKEYASNIVVSITETRYVNTIPTHPFHIVKIPKTDKQIAFEKI